ncbi:MAG TPA: ABC transporter permease [Trebonia sp.]|nr:ABC transporter permease [Trebonia sp.]
MPAGRRQVRLAASQRVDLLTKVALSLLGVVVVVAIIQAWLPDGTANAVGFGTRLASPSSGWALLGTDQLGRAMVPRLLQGTAVTLGIAVPPSVAAALIAALVGCLAATVRGALDTALCRIVDVLFTFPSILLALLLVSIIGPGDLGAIVSIALIVSPQVFRIVRARTLEIAPREFVSAARVSGASIRRIVLVHIVPSASGTIIVQTTFAVIIGMLVESSLSFLGLGVTPPTASLGSLIQDGSPYLTAEPWLTFEPAAVLALIIFSVNIVGDWARDRFEVRQVVEL